MRENRRIFRLFVQNLTLILMVFSLEASVFAVNCLEHLANLNEPAHHMLWEINASQGDDHGPVASHAHPSSTPVKGKALHCHMDDGSGTAFFMYLSFLPESMTPTLDAHSPVQEPGLRWFSADPPQQVPGFFDPPKRPPRFL